jgi:hypothetical protein
MVSKSSDRKEVMNSTNCGINPAIGRPLKTPSFFVIASDPDLIGGAWQSIFTTRLLRRPASCGPPRPAKAGTF